ncbi:hypothetical protein [Clostridium estertheticum]|uniref:hypothetical protein n=1 Tax=Clostridium estertheticum TaxID=238834 RepID=UPI001C7D7601|nr:hypothetical protein [Clostridium estertheticum]MBX4272099.1 hypothetical protein [Clostridium estertheticum]WLC78898.1 hypothetical protein KTC98_17135 [Clostridium estertheticum]
MKKLKLISKLITIIISAISVIFAAIVYTPEYMGKGSKTGVIKAFLDNDITISVLMIIIIVVTLLWIVFALILFSSSNIDKIIIEKNNHKQKNVQLSINIEEYKDKLDQNIKEEANKRKQIIKEEASKREQIIKEHANKRELDSNVIKKIKAVLPVESMMDFTKYSDLGNKFSSQYVEMMDNFFSVEDHPEYRFQDIQLEDLRVNLSNTLKQLNLILIEYSDQISDVDFYRIRRSLKLDNPELYSKIVRESNDTATKAWMLYDSLISLSRQLLGE